MYDVNPNIYGSILSLNVNVNDNSIDLNLAIETAAYYGLSIKEAQNIIRDMVDIINNNWQISASDYGLSIEAINRMKPAFTLK
jgi:serine/threonine-protein kinase HipA